MPLMEENVKLNALDNVKPVVLNWGEETLPADAPNRPDVVLLADCVYFEPAFPLLGASCGALDCYLWLTCAAPQSTRFFS